MPRCCYADQLVLLQFLLTPRIAPQRRPNLAVRIHLPSFLRMDLQATRILVDGLEPKVEMDEEGWLDLRAQGWAFSELTEMETKDIAAI